MTRLTPFAKIVLGAALVLTVIWWCGCASFPPKNADGSLNIPALLDAAEWGLQADCQIPGAVAADICTFGKDAIALARTKGKDPVVVRQTLVDAEAKLPVEKRTVLDWYFNFLIQALGGQV